MTTKLCYNKGCAQSFKDEDNKEDSCRYHPGSPVFHDAYKGWSCCNKKTTDFTEFLNIKGCSIGRHNPEKPLEEPKPRKDVSVDIPVTQETRAPAVSLPRPPASEKMVTLPLKIGASLRPVLEKLKGVGDIKKEQAIEVGQIPFGTNCKNSGCKATYRGEQSDAETCIYHEGGPIFHEGMKYWSCCQRKTSDFSAFLDQEGCSTGKHMWFKQKVTEHNVSCRYDWHQTGSVVVISVFAKASVPEKSFVELNPVKCHIHIVFGAEHSVFDTTIILGGIVEVASSSVELLGSKVEITMKKAEAVSWRTLAWDGPDTNLSGGDKNLSQDMGNVNLDDVEVLVNHEAIEDAKKRFSMGADHR